MNFHPDATLPPEDEDWIWVFGSNLAGVHGAGAARVAAQRYGAVDAMGFGWQGKSFAIPTKDTQIHTLALYSVNQWVNLFLLFTRRHPEMNFWVTGIGCGLAGYKPEEIAPMFGGAPDNCSFPDNWEEHMTTEEVDDEGTTA